MSKRPFGPYAWMLLGCFALAWMGQFAHLLRESCDWRITALARSALAFAFALSFARLSGASLVLWRPGALWVRGCASSLSLLATFYALAQLPTSEVLTLTNTVPIWVAFLSWPLLGVRPSAEIWLAAGCGVLGVALIQAPHLDGQQGVTPAAAIALSAALTSAIAMLGLHRLKGLNSWAIVTHYSGVATLFVLGSWIIAGVPDLTALRETRTLLLLLGVGATATVGQLCVTRAFTAGPPAQVAVVGLMQIVFALALDLLFHGPFLPLASMLGIALVLAPTAWVMVGNARRAAPPASRENPKKTDAASQPGRIPALLHENDIQRPSRNSPHSLLFSLRRALAIRKKTDQQC